ncbi:hypothetical protein CDIK_0425 [Cucumispora dikerogammari]|nr:hypothetical protein CDIK_0425 [Cucumispora dikerogammari]
MKPYNSFYIDRPTSSLTHDQPKFEKLHNYLFYLLNTSPKKQHSQTYIRNKLNTLNFLYCNPHNLMKHLKERHYKIKSKNTFTVHVNLSDINDYLTEYRQQMVMWKKEPKRWIYGSKNKHDPFLAREISTSECKPKLYSFFDKRSPTNLHTLINSVGFSVDEDLEKTVNKTEFLKTFSTPQKLNKNKYGLYTEVETFRDITYKKPYRKGVHSLPIDLFQKHRKMSRGDYGLHVIKLCIIDKIPLPFWLKGDLTMYSKLFGAPADVNKEETSFLQLYDFLKESYKPTNTVFNLTEKARLESEKNKISDSIFSYGMIFSGTQKKFYQIFLMALMENREDIIKLLFKRCTNDKHVFKVNNDINKFNRSNDYSYTNYLDLNSNVFWIKENFLKSVSLKYQFNFKDRTDLRKGVFPRSGMFSNDSAVLSFIYSYIISNGPSFYNLCIATRRMEIFKEFEKFQECDFLSGYSNINNAMLLQLVGNKCPIENKTVTINNESVGYENINFYLSNEQYFLISCFSEIFDSLKISDSELDITEKLDERFIMLEHRLIFQVKVDNQSAIDAAEKKEEDEIAEKKKKALEEKIALQQTKAIEERIQLEKKIALEKKSGGFHKSDFENETSEDNETLQTDDTAPQEDIGLLEEDLLQEEILPQKRDRKNNALQIVRNENIIPIYLEIKDWVFKTINYLKSSVEIEKSLFSERFYEKMMLIHSLLKELRETHKVLEEILGKKYKIEDELFLYKISRLFPPEKDVEENYRLIKFKLKTAIEDLIVFKDTPKGLKNIFKNLFKFEDYSISYFYKNTSDNFYQKGLNYFTSFDKNYRFENKNKLKHFYNLKINRRIFLSDLLTMKTSNINNVTNQIKIIKYQTIFDEIKNVENKLYFLYQSDYQKTLMLFSIMNFLDRKNLIKDGISPLHYAALTGNLDTLIFYLNYFDVNSVDKFGYFPCDYTFLEVFNRRCYMILKLCGGRSKFEEDRFGSTENVAINERVCAEPFDYVDHKSVKKLYRKYKEIRGDFKNYMVYYFERNLLFKAFDNLNLNTDISNISNVEGPSKNTTKHNCKKMNISNRQWSIYRNTNLFYTFCNLDVIKFVSSNVDVSKNGCLKLDESLCDSFTLDVCKSSLINAEESMTSVSNVGASISKPTNLDTIKIKEIKDDDKVPNYLVNIETENLLILKDEEFQVSNQIKPDFTAINKRIEEKDYKIEDLEHKFSFKKYDLQKRSVSSISRNIFFLLLHLSFLDIRNWFSTKISIVSQIISHSINSRFYDTPYDLLNQNSSEVSTGFIIKKNIKNDMLSDLNNFQRHIFQINISSDPTFTSTVEVNNITVNKTFYKKHCSLYEHNYNLYLYDFFRDHEDLRKGPAHNFAIHLTKNIDWKARYSVFMPWTGIISTGLECKKNDDEIIKSLMLDMHNTYALYRINSHFSIEKKYEFENVFIKCEDFLVDFDLFMNGINWFNELVFN